jgi:hypothetical protein
MAKTPIVMRIIDNKKVSMTNDEFMFYEEICKGYDRPNFKGKDLFQDHFEVNDDGIIVFVKPPYKKYSSMEVFTFLISLMVNQQLRISQDQVVTLIGEAKQKFAEQFAEIDTLKQVLQSYKEEVERMNVAILKKNDDGT